MGEVAVARQKQPKFRPVKASADNGNRRTKRRQTRVYGKQQFTTVRIIDLILRRI